MDRRTLIKHTVSDLVGHFVYYHRKEDEELPRGEIESAVAAGEITVDEMIDQFASELRAHFRA